MTNPDIPNGAPWPQENNECVRYEELLALVVTDQREVDEVNPQERLALLRHIEACARCQEAAKEQLKIEEALQRFLEPTDEGEPFQGIVSFSEILQRAVEDEAGSRSDSAMRPQETGYEIVNVGRASGDPPTADPTDSASGIELSSVDSTQRNSMGSLRTIVGIYVADSLTRPDDPAWSTDSLYSAAVAMRLIECYMRLKSSGGTMAAYEDVYYKLQPHMQTPMALRQRLRWQYLMAMSYAAAEDYSAALDILADTFELASQLSAFRCLAELAYLQGAIHEYLGLTRPALSDFKSVKQNLSQAHETLNYATDNELLLDSTIKVATQQFLLMQYTQSTAQLDEAHAIVRAHPMPRHLLGALAWVDTLLNRWRGDLFLAKEAADEAIEVYTAERRPGPLAVIQSVAANVALDAAETAISKEVVHNEWAFSIGSTGLERGDARMPHLQLYYGRTPVPASRTELLDQARELVQGSVANATVEESAAVRGLALLAETRYSRLIGEEKDRRSIYASVIKTATNIDDIPLLGQAYTGLGDEFFAQGERNLAVNLYSKALDALSMSAAPAWGAWPHRRLMLLGEMDSDFRRDW